MGSLLATRRNPLATRKERCSKNGLDCTNWGESSKVRYLLGAVMEAKRTENRETPSVLDVVALLADIPAAGLARGQVGTVVEQVDDASAIVEFSDDHGRAYAIATCSRAGLLVLRYVPEAAWTAIPGHRVAEDDARRLGVGLRGQPAVLS